MKEEHNSNEGKRVRHMVIFSLKYDKNAHETEKFLYDSKSILSSIPVVEKFEVLKLICCNDYHFGFSMEFEDKSAYEVYKTHPLHINFVENRWKKEVVHYMEIDSQDFFGD